MKPVVAPIVFHLSRFLGAGDTASERAVALACHATQAGHVCADLECEAGWGPWAAEMDAAQRTALRERLSEMPVVGGTDDWSPLVWDGRRLFLRRYWDYERQVAQDLLARSARENRLTVISGGPGTGKTTTLARIIGLLLEQSPTGSQPLRIALAAPTGKAAARMTDALAAAGTMLPAMGAMTLHRLLGMRADGSGFRHDRAHPLAVDVLLVDEASMIDLSLMAHLLAALPADARLFLLGDRDQLSAVEAGAVFADLCASTSLASCVTTLTTNFRFGGDSGIGRLAESLRLGDTAGAIAQLRAGGPDLVWQGQGDMRALIAAARDGYRPYREAVAAALPPEALFERFNDFRVLCAHRQDVVAINRALMADDGVRPAPGTPVMVVRNDALLRLFNGDIGLVLPDPLDGSLKVCFPGGSAGPRRIPLARLPAWEPAWAMTVHKSQGSEFVNVLLSLPSSVSRVTTRELVYTGVTRARRCLALWAGEAVLQAAIECRAERMSGLREKLTSAYRSD